MDGVITLDPAHLEAVAGHAEAAYPAECCGLLIGAAEGARVWRVHRVVQSRNLAPAGRRDRFEVDPALRLKLQRELRGSGEAVVGLYHSHPDGPPTPSATDLDSAWDEIRGAAKSMGIKATALLGASADLSIVWYHHHSSRRHRVWMDLIRIYNEDDLVATHGVALWLFDQAERQLETKTAAK